MANTFPRYQSKRKVIGKVCLDSPQDEAIVFALAEGWSRQEVAKMLTVEIAAIDALLLFDVPGRNQAQQNSSSSSITIASIPWTLKKAVAYLLNLYPASWAFDPASFNDSVLEIFDYCGDPQLTNVNLEGKSLLEGLSEILSAYNYCFAVDPCPTGLDGTFAAGKFAIKFYYKGIGPSTAAWFPPRNSSSSSSSSNYNCINADYQGDWTGVINHVTVYGEQKVFTTLAQYRSDSKCSRNGKSR